MARLDNAGVNGSHGYLEHALSGDWSERMECSCDARYDTIRRKVLAKCVRVVGPIVVDRRTCRIRIAFWREPEEIHHLTFDPIPHWVLRRYRRERRCCGVDRRRRFQSCP